MGAPVPLGGGSSRPLLLPPHGDEDQGKALGPCMPASFASTQLESDRCRFENPLRFRRMGNCSRGDSRQTEKRRGRNLYGIDDEHIRKDRRPLADGPAHDLARSTLTYGSADE